MEKFFFTHFRSLHSGIHFNLCYYTPVGVLDLWTELFLLGRSLIWLKNPSKAEPEANEIFRQRKK